MSERLTLNHNAYYATNHEQPRLPNQEAKRRLGGISMAEFNPERTEQGPVSAEMIATALTYAQKLVEEMRNDQQFLDWCEQRSVNPRDDRQPDYWAELADYTQNRIAEYA
jgi:hypothetical protein